MRRASLFPDTRRLKEIGKIYPFLGAYTFFAFQFAQVRLIDVWTGCSSVCRDFGACNAKAPRQNFGSEGQRVRLLQERWRNGPWESGSSGSYHRFERPYLPAMLLKGDSKFGGHIRRLSDHATRQLRYPRLQVVQLRDCWQSGGSIQQIDEKRIGNTSRLVPTAFDDLINLLPKEVDGSRRENGRGPATGRPNPFSRARIHRLPAGTPANSNNGEVQQPHGVEGRKPCSRYRHDDVALSAPKHGSVCSTLTQQIARAA
jgi:hypothetical protein